MPPAVAAAAITAGASVGTGVLATRAQSGANKRASQVQAKSDADAMAFQIAQEHRRQQEFDREQAEDQRRWDAEQQIAERQRQMDEEDRAYTRRLTDEREARMAPRRAASRAALLKMGDLLGINFDSSVRQPSVAPAGAGAPTSAGPVRQASSALTMNRLMPPQQEPASAAAIPGTEANYSPVLTMNRLMPSQARRRPYGMA